MAWTLPQGPHGIPLTCNRIGHAIRSWVQWQTPCDPTLFAGQHNELLAKNVWVSTRGSKVTLLTDFANYSCQHSGDIKIMHLLLMNSIKQPQLHYLNQCQLFLKVFWVSDIVSGDGELICPQFWVPQEPVDSPFEWSSTQQLAPHEWILWKQALTSSLHLGWNQQLAQPLGEWGATSNPSSWYYHHETNSLWEVANHHWKHHGSLPQQTQQLKFHANGVEEVPPLIGELEKAMIN